MKTYTLTYRKQANRDLVALSLSKRIDRATDINILRQCCGSLAYASLFLLPEWELEDRKVYSIENVCTHVPGLFKLFMHEVLEALGNIALGVNIDESVKTLLECAGFYECFEMLGVKPSDWYRVFLAVHLKGKPSYAELQNIQTFDALASYYCSKEGFSYA